MSRKMGELTQAEWERLEGARGQHATRVSTSARWAWKHADGTLSRARWTSQAAAGSALEREQARNAVGLASGDVDGATVVQVTDRYGRPTAEVS